MESQRRPVKGSTQSLVSSRFAHPSAPASSGPSAGAGGTPADRKAAESGEREEAHSGAESVDGDDEAGAGGLFASPLSLGSQRLSRSICHQAPPFPGSAVVFQTPSFAPPSRGKRDRECLSQGTPPRLARHSLGVPPAADTAFSPPSQDQRTPPRPSSGAASGFSSFSGFSSSVFPHDGVGTPVGSPALGVGRAGPCFGAEDSTPVLRQRAEPAARTEGERGGEGAAETGSLAEFLSRVEDLLRTAASPWWWDVDVAQLLTFFLSLSESGTIQLGDAAQDVRERPPEPPEACLLEGDCDAAQSPIVTPRRFVAAAVAAVGGSGGAAATRAGSQELLGAYRMEFTQAALFLERLAKVWGRKIEHLHALFLHMLQSMNVAGTGGKAGDALRGAAAIKAAAHGTHSLRFIKQAILQEVLESVALCLPAFPQEASAKRGEGAKDEEEERNKNARPPDVVRLPPVLRKKTGRPGRGGARETGKAAEEPQRGGEPSRASAARQESGGSAAGSAARGDAEQAAGRTDAGGSEEEESAMATRYREFRSFRLTSFLLHEASGGLMVDSRDTSLYDALLLRPEKKRRRLLPCSLAASPSGTSLHGPVPAPAPGLPPAVPAPSASASSADSALQLAAAATALPGDLTRLPSEGLGECLDFGGEDFAVDCFEDPAPASASAAEAAGRLAGDVGAATEGVGSSADAEALSRELSGAFFFEEERGKAQHRQDLGIDMSVPPDDADGADAAAAPPGAFASREAPLLSVVDLIQRAWLQQQREQGADRVTALRRLLHASRAGDWSVCTAPPRETGDAKRTRPAGNLCGGDSQKGLTTASAASHGAAKDVCASEAHAVKQGQGEASCPFCLDCEGARAHGVGAREEAGSGREESKEKQNKRQKIKPRARYKLMSLREEEEADDKAERRPLKLGSCTRIPPPFYAALPSSAFASAPATAALAFHRVHTPQGLRTLLQGLWSPGELAAAENVICGGDAASVKEEKNSEKASSSRAWREALAKAKARTRKANVSGAVARPRGAAHLPFYPDIQLPNPLLAPAVAVKLPASAPDVATAVKRPESDAEGEEASRDDLEVRGGDLRRRFDAKKRGRKEKAPFGIAAAGSAIGCMLETSRWKWMEDVVYARLRERAMLRQRLKRKIKRETERGRKGADQGSLAASLRSPEALPVAREAAEEAEALVEAVEERILRPVEAWRELEESAVDAEDIFDVSDAKGDADGKVGENGERKSALSERSGDGLMLALLSGPEKEKLEQQLRAAVSLPLAVTEDGADDHLEGFSAETSQKKIADRELLQRVATWSVFLDAQLRQSAALPPFDIRAYERTLLQRVAELAQTCCPSSPRALPPPAPLLALEDGSPSSPETLALTLQDKSFRDGGESLQLASQAESRLALRENGAPRFPNFSEVADGQKSYEVCRLFLCTLLLTNKGKLDIIRAEDGQSEAEEEEASWQRFLEGKIDSSGRDRSSATRDFAITVLAPDAEIWSAHNGFGEEN
ncbi:hypothetical protein BESB_047210 [Besnoitia besnoiti]|uniref:Condensin-2 complex subunit H2 C-terminal domain-containing protein n=1 Tax=Besnoitia besnoiti TaxID=94643 RepID=A0A2A9MF58_BESBE|nr:hypothetical protein BESB_047210 [Besnoitia besnoiti]PFH36529.1 hypothetical protein BESB_047210 [Besnoitia besnoiti]